MIHSGGIGSQNNQTTTTGALRGAGAGRNKNFKQTGGGPVSKSGTKTNQKTKKKKA